MAATRKRLGRGLGELIAGGVKKDSLSTMPEEASAKETAESEDRKFGLPETVRSSAVAGEGREQIPRDQGSVSRMESPSRDSETEGGTSEAAEYREISLALISHSPYQPRQDIDEGPIAELAESIRSQGLLQPLVVRVVDGGFQLIAGERRLRACMQLNLKRIPARVIVASDASSAVMSLIENLQREGLNPIEEARGYACLIRDFDLTQEAVAERVGKGRATVANALRLLQLEKEIHGYLSKGLLSVGHAKVLLGIEGGSQRMLVARRIIEAGLSVRELERLIRRFKDRKETGRARSGPGSDSAVIRDLEQRLTRQLNTRVSIKHTPRRGRIIIEYHGNEDLQRILEKIGIPP